MTLSVTPQRGTLDPLTIASAASGLEPQPGPRPDPTDRLDPARPPAPGGVELDALLGQLLAAANLPAPVAAALARRLPQIVEDFGTALALLEAPRPTDPQAALALAEHQLQVKQRLFAMLTKIDAEFPGQLETTIGVVLEALDRQGKLPAALAAEKAVLAPLACATIRSEAHILFNPKYRTWERLAQELYCQVDAALRGPDGRRLTLDDGAFYPALEGLTGANFSAGNVIEPLGEGQPFLDAVLDLVRTSPGPLFVNYWAIYDDASGHALVQALIERAREGVPIYVMVDARVASRPHHGVEVIALLEQAARQHPSLHVMRWIDPQEPTEGTHSKAVTDGTTAVFGGSNMGVPYTHQGAEAKDCWSDANYRARGPVVGDILSYLIERWNHVVRHGGAPGLPTVSERAFGKRWALPAEATGEEAAWVSQAPGDDHRITLALLAAAEGATDTLRIENAYFIMTPLLEALVRRALARGVRIELVTNSLQSVDEPIVARPIVASARRLLEIATELGRPELAAVWLKQGATLHDKRALCDRRLLLAGSANLHQQSEWLQHEVLMLARGAATIERELAGFEADKAQCRAVTRPEEIELPPASGADKLLLLFENQL